MMTIMEKDFDPLKSRLREINERLDTDEQASFGLLIEKFSGNTSEFQRIMRDLGKFGSKIGTGSKFEVYREVQHLFHNAPPKK
jgi:tetrahydromethanopterin S-methyltransferase subunit G|tara:strand:- start:70 stop:318 length:249 start_codon:yes stop_codon:yes gene_type:complete